MKNDYKLPCKACMTTSNHCCMTDVQLSFPDAILMMGYAKDLGKDVVLGEHPSSMGTLMMVPNKQDMDINREPCVFVGYDGKCEIYEDRPSTCRTYGTEHMRCRFEYSGITSAFEIAKMNISQIRVLDDAAMDKEFSILGKMVKFDKA